MNDLQDKPATGEGLQQARAKTNLSQTELARLSGVPRPRIVEYENGRKDFMNATIRTADKLAKAMNTSIDRLIHPEEEEER